MKTFDYYLPPKTHGKVIKTFYGTLTVTDWNKDDEPTEFSIFTITEADILLGSPHFKKKYLKLLGSPVKIIGELKINDYGEEYISVRKIKRVNFFEFEFLSHKAKATNMLDFQDCSPIVAKNLLRNSDYNNWQATA